MTGHTFTYFGLLYVLVFGLFAAGCDNTIEPFEEETGVFSVYGYLEVAENPNFIRVRDLNDPLVGGEPRDLDAVVTLHNLTNGAVEVLEDSLMLYDDIYVHNFLVNMPIEPEHEFRVTVERSDGATVESRATAPQVIDVYLDTDLPPAFPNLDECNNPMRVDFFDVVNPRELRISFGFYVSHREYQVEWTAAYDPEEGVSSIVFSPQDLLDRQFPPIDPDDRVHCSDMTSDHLFVQYYHFGPEWLEFDVPTNPLEALDVDNGLGFFGALRNEMFTVEIDTTGPPGWEM